PAPCWASGTGATCGARRSLRRWTSRSSPTTCPWPRTPTRASASTSGTRGDEPPAAGPRPDPAARRSRRHRPGARLRGRLRHGAGRWRAFERMERARCRPAEPARALCRAMGRLGRWRAPRLAGIGRSFPGHAPGRAVARPPADSPVGRARPRRAPGRPRQFRNRPADAGAPAGRAVAALSRHDARAAIRAARARSHQQHSRAPRRFADRARQGSGPAPGRCPARAGLGRIAGPGHDRTGRPMNPTDVATATPAVAAADPWRRLMGAIYECVLLFGVLWFADYLFSALTRFQGEAGPMRIA